MSWVNTPCIAIDMVACLDTADVLDFLAEVINKLDNGGFDPCTPTSNEWNK